MASTIHFDPVQNYDCIQCGRGCRMGWDIPVEPRVLEGLQGHPLVLRVIQDKGAPFRHEDDQSFIKSSKECKECGFLEGDNLCGIHRELGFAAKPSTCQVFPFVITDTPDGYFVGTTYYCSSVRENSGRPLSEHRDDVQALLDASAPMNKVAADGLVIYNRYYTNWADYVALETELVRQAAEVGYLEALSRAVLGVAAAMAELPRLEEEPEAYPGEKLRAAWQHPRIPGGQASRQLGQVVSMQIGDFFKFYLDKEDWDEVDGAIFAGGTFRLPQYGFEGTWLQLQDLVGHRVGTRFDEQIERYLAHLVFRKALVVHPPLLASLCQLQMLTGFLRTYTALIAFHAGRQEAAQHDYYDALEIAETYLVTHGRNRRIVNDMAADVLVGTFRPKAVLG
jgi:Fe-S-cluster containining protein